MFYTQGLMTLVPMEMPGIETMGVTKNGILLWDPKFVSDPNTTIATLGAVLVHELMHLLQNHHLRALPSGAEPQLWNIAADCEINDDLREMMTLPDFVVEPEKYKLEPGLTAEEYYEALREMSEEQQQAGGQPQCGSGAGNPIEGEPDGEGGEGDADGDSGGMGRSPSEIDAMRRETADAIQSEDAKGQGTVPEGMRRWADSVLTPPKVNWRAKLARAVRSAVAFRAGSVNFRYDRPSRRQGAFGVSRIGVPVLPALRRPVPQVGIGVDTSGSMGQGELADAIRESAGILSAVGAQVSFIACDAQAHVGKVRSANELSKLLVGGGGTDFCPVFEAVPKLKPRPEIFVFITDGGGPAPRKPPPGVHVIWLLVGRHRMKPWASDGDGGWGRSDDSVTWGEFIEVDDDRDDDEGY